MDGLNISKMRLVDAYESKLYELKYRNKKNLIDM